MTHASSPGDATRPVRVLVVTCAWPTLTSPIDGCFVEQQVRALRAAGAEIEVYAFRGARNPLRYLKAWFDVHRAIRSSRFDLVHAQFGQSGTAAIVPKRLPLVVTFRGDDLAGIVGKGGRYLLLGRILRRVSRAVARRADVSICVSERLAAELPGPAEIIPSGLDLDLFRRGDQIQAREELGLPPGPLVLFAGSPHDPRKDVRLAEAAVALTPGAELVVAHGVPRERMPLYYSACDVLILTSLHEGSPNVVKEALACDLPVVSVAVGDVPARVEGVPGCAIVDRDPHALATALTKAIGSAPTGGSDAVRELAEPLLAERVMAIYRRLSVR